MEKTVPETFPMKQVSAWLPVVMSFTALFVVMSHVMMFGAAREADEGFAAHLWQLLMGLQLPLVLWFSVKWLRRTPGPASTVLAVQVLAAFTAVAPVWFFKL